MKKLSSILLGILFLLMPWTTQQAQASEIGLQDLPPKLFIESYEVVEGQLIPGEQFTLHATIKNSNPFIDAQNIMLTYASTNTTVYPVYGESNQTFIDTIKAGETKKIELHMEVTENARENIASILIQMDYASDNASNTISNSTLILPISANCSMDINTLSVAQSSTIGSKSLVSIAYSNTGLADIKNATMHIEGDILNDQKEIVLGDLLFGAQASKDCYVNFQHEGEQTLTISFTYEDGEGTVFSIPEAKFTSTVNPIALDTPVEIQTIDQNKTLMENLQPWQLAAIVGGLIAILIIIFLIVKIKNRRRF